MYEILYLSKIQKGAPFVDTYMQNIFLT